MLYSQKEHFKLANDGETSNQNMKMSKQRLSTFLLYLSLYLLLAVSVSAQVDERKLQLKPLQPKRTTSTAPTWSAWPGEGAPLRGSGIQTTWAASWRYVDTELERPRWRMTLNYQLLKRLQLGLEYNPAASEVSPLFNLFLFTETDIRPALFLGTSSDRIGSPAGKQAYFITAAKRVPYVPLSVYATMNYSEWDEAFNYPFGASD